MKTFLLFLAGPVYALALRVCFQSNQITVRKPGLVRFLAQEGPALLLLGLLSLFLASLTW